jgi:putative cell wall-binding protein
MMVTDITGRTIGEADGMLALIKFVSEPEVYRARLKELTDATDAHRKAIELVGPAEDILVLRAEAEADRNTARESALEAKAAAAEAKKDAKDIVKKAEQEAETTLTSARNAAAAIVSDAKSQLEKAEASGKQVKTEQAKNTAAQEAIKRMEVQLAASLQAVADERFELEELRTSLRNKLADISKAAGL